MKYHERTWHSKEISDYPFSCEHLGCNKKFKNKKLKMMHHNQMEPNCNTEKINLIKLIKKYKEFLNYLISLKKIDVSENLECYRSLNNAYTDAKNKLIDTEILFCLVGKNLEDSDLEDSKINEVLDELNQRNNEYSQ